MSFYINNSRGRPHNMYDLHLMGFYSISGNREYSCDLSQLKYYKEPSDINNVNIDLNDKIEDTIYKTGVHPKLDYMLKWISENFDRLKVQDSRNSTRWLQPEFISTRGTLKTLLLTPYDRYSGWIICAAKFKGTIYFCHFYSEEKAKQILNETPAKNAASAWGKKFEQYMLTRSPTVNPDLSVPCNQNEDFYCTFQSRINNHIFLYAAEMDGLCSQQITQDTLLGKNVKFIELKTAHYRSFEKGKNFKHKMLNWWAQSYFVCIENVICGLRDDNGIIKKLQKINLNEFDNYIMDRQRRCKILFSQFCNYMKSVVQQEHDQILYKFTYRPGTSTISVTEMKPNPESEYFLLHAWYVEKATAYFENR